MKKIVPFKKDIYFDTNISEITSISLENNLQIDNNMIEGEFLVSGTYRITDLSTTTEKFDYQIPFSINLDDRYILDKAIIDIDDFYYEIINGNILSINIDVMIDKVEEKRDVEELDINFSIDDNIKNSEEIISVDLGNNDEVDIIEEFNEYEEFCKMNREGESEMEQVEKNEKIEIDNKKIEKVETTERASVEENVKSLFDNFDDSTETYSTYKVYIVREGDTIENILAKYNVSLEKLQLYNDIKEIKVGDKIIIPC